MQLWIMYEFLILQDQPLGWQLVGCTLMLVSIRRKILFCTGTGMFCIWFCLFYKRKLCVFLGRRADCISIWCDSPECQTFFHCIYASIITRLPGASLEWQITDKSLSWGKFSRVGNTFHYNICSLRKMFCLTHWEPCTFFFKTLP